MRQVSKAALSKPVSRGSSCARPPLDLRLKTGRDLRGMTRAGGTRLDAARALLQGASVMSNVPALLPVTVISGFVGAGKSSLLKHLLAHTGGRRVAVIVNDRIVPNAGDPDAAPSTTRVAPARSGSMPAVHPSTARAQVAPEQERLIEMPRGCICCSLREDLLVAVRQLA